MSTKDRVMAVGVLTQRDLDILGTGFHRMFSIADGDDQDDGLPIFWRSWKDRRGKARSDASCAIKQHLGGG
jgi:hypothetical protein